MVWRMAAQRLCRAGLLWLVNAAVLATGAETRPNIVWIIAEDMSPHFSCYAEDQEPAAGIQTPHVDRLAQEGLLFRRAFTTGPVCSASRSALITGMYKTSVGAHHHRSGRGREKIRLAEEIPLVPQLFQAAGYYTCNSDWRSSGLQPGKTDYNFVWDERIYSGADWARRKPEQPFFAQIQLAGGKLREGRNWADEARRALGELTDPARVTLPPDLPRDPVILEDWARYLDAVRYTDLQVGQVLQRLESEGLLANTVVFFLTDHGISHVRAKQFCYDAGLRIPLVVRGPGVGRNAVREDLVEHLDIAATSLALAGIAVPEPMHGRNLLAADYQPRKYAMAARDRCDETVDRIRSVRNERFKYIRNFYPQRPYLQPNAYKDNKPIVRAVRQLQAAGKLDEQQSLIMAEHRPREELYDLQADPHELRNLAAERALEPILIALRGELAAWIARTHDQGQTPEAAAMYQSDMEVYLREIRPRDPERAREIEANIQQMYRWHEEGK